MQIKFTKTTGRFKYTATAQPSEEVLAALAEQGIVRVLQGSVLANWEKEIAYPGKGVKRPEKNAEGEKWSRSDIEFSETYAEKLKRAILGAEVVTGQNEKDEDILSDIGIVTVEVEEYSGAEAAVPKFQAEKNLLKVYLFEDDGKTQRKLASGEMRSVASFCASRGLAVPTDPYEEDVEFLKAVKAWQKAQAASQD